MAGPARKRQKREGKAEGELPQKKYYRQRAHANPFSDHDLTYPASPAHMDWSKHYPAFMASSATTDDHPAMTAQVRIADIGCGFGGLLFALSPQVPADTLVLGLEIRASVTEYVAEKIKAMRASAAPSSASASSVSSSPTKPTPGSYQNISALRSNTMKHLPNLFPRAALTTIFLCFPDPHFKARKHKARIVSPALCAEYAYVLQPGVGRVYTVTDVADLHSWMVGHFAAHPLFRRVEDEELRGGAGGKGDPYVAAILATTEEGKKVERNGGQKLVAVFERREDPPWEEEVLEGGE